MRQPKTASFLCCWVPFYAHQVQLDVPINEKLGHLGRQHHFESLCCAEMTAQEIIAVGKKDIQDIDTRLGRAERIVEDTVQIGVQV